MTAAVEGYSSVPLSEEHHTNFFNCGETSLDDWLNRNALTDHRLGKSKTHVWTDPGGMVIGYYTLLQTTVREDDSQGGLFKRLRPKSFRGGELPGILIGKLALDSSLRGQGLGLDLLADAYVAAYEAVQLVGGVLLVIEPGNNEPKLRSLYSEFGFQSYEGVERMFLNFEAFNEGTPL